MRALLLALLLFPRLGLPDPGEPVEAPPRPVWQFPGWIEA